MKATTDELEELIEQKVEERTSHLHDRIDKLESTVEHLESELEVQSGNVRGAHARIGKVEDKQDTETPSGDQTPRLDADKQDFTVLEEIVSYPEEEAERHLTPNQQRARFIAKDVLDYGRKVPDGIRMDSTDMKRVLNAAADDGETIYRTSVKRTIEFLDDFGEGEIKVMKNRGKKFVVFGKELVKRLQRNSVCYDANPKVALQTG